MGMGSPSECGSFLHQMSVRELHRVHFFGNFSFEHGLGRVNSLGLRRGVVVTTTGLYENFGYKRNKAMHKPK